nr:hypothetical protein BaRGS_021253 [Batillaria attramentaria]
MVTEYEKKTKVAYLVFLSLYSYLLLVKLSPSFHFLEVIILVWIFTIFAEELRQVVAYNVHSVRSNWKKCLDACTVAVFFVGVALRLLIFVPCYKCYEVGRVILSINLVQFCVRLLFSFAINKELGPKVVMIRRMITDLMWFFVILLVFVFAYTIASEAILYPNTEVSMKLLYYLPRKAYWQIYGELFLDELEGDVECTNNRTLYSGYKEHRCPSAIGQYMVPIMMAVYVLITNVLLLNLLIAMFRPPPPVPPDIPPAAQLLDISTNPPTKTEIIKAIKSLKSGKAAGPDGIPPEALKADIQTSTDMLHPLLRKIWESESVPQDWKKGHMVLTRIILERLKTALDKTLREEQAGFRNDRSCTDHIATMRIIIEQSLEWQTPLYSTFVDFQKAFDSVDREVIWKLMSHYGFPPKFVNIIRQLYEDATCQVIHDGKLTEPFTVRTGVRQGCILSPTIFLMVVDWVMRQATDGKRTGIQWTFSKQLEDLDFADDIALLSHKQQDAQEKLNRVAEEAEKTGLKINISKTEVMRVNHKQHDPIQLHQEDIKEVDKFIYLGSVVSKDGGTDEDIKSRTNKARHAFRTLRPIWRSTALSLRNKIRIFNSNVKSVLLYGSETWRTTKTGSHRLQTFINRCLRNILNIRYPLVITNQDLWEQTRQVPIEQEIKKRKWGWIGHTLRKPTSNVTRQSLDWNPQGKRKVGRPKQTWRRNRVFEEKKNKELVRWEDMMVETYLSETEATTTDSVQEQVKGLAHRLDSVQSKIERFAEIFEKRMSAWGGP